MRPDAADYESVIPSRSRLVRMGEAEAEVWRPSARGEAFENESADSSATEQLSSANDEPRTNVNWLRKRGHSLTYAFLFLFSIILYFRPYELIPGLSSFTSMAFYTGLATLIIYAVSQLSLEGNLTARPREINLALLIGLAALLSIPLAINPGEAWTTFSELVIKTLLIFVVIVNVVRTERRLEWMILLALVVSVYLSINAIQDYQLGVFKIGKAENHNLRIAGVIRGLFENSNDLALHLVTMAPIAFALAFVKRNIVLRLLFLGSAVLMVAAIVVTFSRGGFLGLIAVAFVLVRKFGRSNRVSATAGFVFAILVFLAFAPGDYAGRISTIFDSAGDLTGSSTQRSQVLQRSVLVAMRYPLFGVGLGNFHYRSFQELGTHNSYTQVASEMGIPAMVLYMMFLLAPLKRLRDVERESSYRMEDRKYYYLAIGLQASLIGFMVSSFFGAVAYQWYIYYLVGYAICLHRLFLMRPLKKEL